MKFYIMRYSKKENEEWENIKPKRARFVTWYAYKTGVFPSPAGNGKWVARVKKGDNRTIATLSQHNTEEEAQRAYDDYYS